MKTRHLQKWEMFESDLCKFLGIDHIGGSGSPTVKTQLIQLKQWKLKVMVETSIPMT